MDIFFRQHIKMHFVEKNVASFIFVEAFMPQSRETKFIFSYHRCTNSQMVTYNVFLSGLFIWYTYHNITIKIFQSSSSHSTHPFPLKGSNRVVWSSSHMGLHMETEWLFVVNAVHTPNFSSKFRSFFRFFLCAPWLSLSTAERWEFYCFNVS